MTCGVSQITDYLAQYHELNEIIPKKGRGSRRNLFKKFTKPFEEVENDLRNYFLKKKVENHKKYVCSYYK